MIKRKIRPLVAGILLICAILIGNSVTYAQSGNDWEDGCSDAARELIDPVPTALDYDAACEVYRGCDASGNGDAACQMKALAVLMADCEDATCQQTAMLYAAAILAFDYPFGEYLDYVPSDAIRNGFPAGLQAFQEGDYAAALNAYQGSDDFYESLVTMLPFSRAIVHQAMGDSDAALDEFAAALEISFDEPLARYGRALLLGELGRVDEASFEGAWLEAFAEGDAALERFVAPLLERFPLDESLVGDWLLYPVMTNGGGVFCDCFSDETSQPPELVSLAIYDNAILAYDLSTRDQWQEDPVNVLVLQSADGQRFGLGYPAIFDNSGGLSLARVGDVFISREWISFFEGFAAWDGLLAPVDAPDPRADLHGFACDGGLISRLHVGQTVRHNEQAGRITYTDAPGNAEMVTRDYGDVVTIIDGPQCIDGMAWWQFELTDGETGWVPEILEDVYVFNPIEGGRPLYCPQTPQTRLFVGAQAVVIEGLGANNIRAEAAADAELLGTLPPESVFNVIGGPLCADGFVWWHVEYEELSGWTAEGEGESYWLQPFIED